METDEDLLRELKRITTRRIRALFGDRDEIGRVRYLAWNWGYLGRAAVALYAATGDPEVLDLILGAHDSFVSTRDDRRGRVDDYRGRVMKAWSNLLRPDENIRKGLKPGLRSCEVECTGLILLPFTDLLLQVRPDMLPDQVRQRLLETIVDGIEAHVPDFIEHAPSRGGYFVSPWMKKIEPLNHSHLFGAAAAEAYALTGREPFGLIAQRLYNFFKANWHRERNGTISWSYSPNHRDSQNDHAPMEYGRPGYNHRLGAEFVDKASMTLELPVAMHRAGLLPDDELRTIAMSLSVNIFRPGARLNLHIGPRKIRSCIDAPRNFRPHHLGSYDLLARVHPVIAERLDALITHRKDLFPQGWHSGAALMLAHARRVCGPVAELSPEGAANARRFAELPLLREDSSPPAVRSVEPDGQDPRSRTIPVLGYLSRFFSRR